MIQQNPRFTILLLALAQAFYACTIIIVFSTASLVGLNIAADRSFATAPVTTFVIGAMLMTIPASFLMQKYGRKRIFLTGGFSGLCGAALATWAIFNAQFYVFCCATMLMGVFQATSSFNSFAATEVASPEDKQMSISWVLTGGVVAAVLGSFIGRNASDLIAAAPFAGAYIASGILCLFAILMIFLAQLPRPLVSQVAGSQRGWGALLKQRQLIAAMAAGICGYALMNLMMTAAPVAMHDHGFTKGDSFSTIQWHVLAMFVPSFFTGLLIKRFGVTLITSIGLCILIGAGGVGLTGVSLMHFNSALILLGLGWNFAFIGGTTMLTQTYEPAERAKVQGVNNFLISLVQVFTSFASGAMLSHWGWNSVPVLVIPVSLGVLALVYIGRRK
jgi:MFS family permease